MNTRLLLLAPLAALALTSSAAAARPVVVGTVLAADARGPAMADGDGTIALVPRAGTIRLFDRGGRAFRDVQLGQHCQSPFPERAMAIGGGRVLFPCGTPSRTEVRIVDVASGAIEVPPGAGAALDELYEAGGGQAGVPAFHSDVGAFGLRLTAAWYKENFLALLLDHAGGRVTVPRSETTVEDLDSPGLRRPLCAPLHNPAWRTLLYDGRYGVDQHEGADLTIQRCGSAERLVLEPWRSSTNPQSAVLDAGYVTWRTGGSAYFSGASPPLRAYLPACGVRLEWRVATFSSVAHVRGALILSERDEGTGLWRVRRISLAGVCPRTTAAWTLAAMNGRRFVRAPARTGTLRLLNRGALATRVVVPDARTPRLALRAGTRVVARFGADLRSLRWRVDGGSWHTARLGLGASFVAPSLAGPGTLHVEARFLRGGRATATVPVGPARPR